MPAAARFRRLSPWLAIALILGLALVVRLPELATIPAPTDETDELMVAWGIYRDGDRPLTTSEVYLGPLFVYAIAAAYALLGPSFQAARTVALISSALAVVGAYWLGLRLGGTMSAVTAAALTLFAFGLVVMGHVAWSHDGAPSWVALALAALLTVPGSVHRRAWAVVAGGLGGVAVGAHPTVLALAPGAALWWLLSGGELRSRLRLSIWIGAGFALAYSPGIVFLAREGLTPFVSRVGSNEYAGVNVTGWPAGVVLWLTSLARNVAGPATLVPADWRMWFSGAVLACGLVFCARTRNWLPLAAVASAALLTPLLVSGDKFTSLTGLRFAGPAFPVAAAAVGCWVAVAVQNGGRRRMLVPLTVGALVVVQAVSLAVFYQHASAGGVTGAPVLAIAEGLRDASSQHDLLFIDDDIDTKLAGGGDVGRAMATMLTLSDTPYTKAKEDKIRWYLMNGDGATYDMLLSGSTVDALEADLDLEPMSVVKVRPGQVSRTGDRWGWYRYTSSPDQRP